MTKELLTHDEKMPDLNKFNSLLLSQCRENMDHVVLTQKLHHWHIIFFRKRRLHDEKGLRPSRPTQVGTKVVFFEICCCGFVTPLPEGVEDTATVESRNDATTIPQSLQGHSKYSPPNVCFYSPLKSCLKHILQ